IMVHEPGMERWVGGMDAEAVIGVAREEELALYSGISNVRAVVGRNVLVLTELVMRTFPDCFDQAPAGAMVPGQASDGTPFRPRVAPRVAPRPITAITGSPPGPPSEPPSAPPAGTQRPAGLHLRGLVAKATNMLS